MTWIKEARAACDDDKHEHLIVAQEMRRAYLRHALDALEKAEALERALWRAVEVMEFTYMNAPKQPKEIAEARQALTAYREAMK